MRTLNLSLKVVLSGLLIAQSYQIYAAPQITSVANSDSSPNKITVSGSGFTEENQKVLLFDLVSNRDLYSNLSSGTEITSSNTAWGDVSGTNWGRTPPKFVKSGNLRYNGAVGAYQGAVSFLEKPKALSGLGLNKLYVSWYFHPDYLVDSGEANKYIRIWDRLDGLGTRISWTTMHITYEARELNYSPPADWVATRAPANQWNHFEIYVDAEKNLIEAKMNGDIKHRVTDFRKSSDTEGLTVGLVGFDPVDNDKYAGTEFRMSDIYISNSRARIEVSDSPTYDPTSHRELLPYDSWSNGGIVAELTPAAQDMDTMYLYVIDSNGDANKEGFPITGCEKCPSPPASINIK
ncbi:hypothetical protein [Marinobacter sp. R17]|uniref:hypothetical protein n=1 Tax=Marinobacter sp. R17 TaxID=2484250 RepID=UPI000F4B4076|nr:hypothetical protein [Marinobacter sp. R17]